MTSRKTTSLTTTTSTMAREVRHAMAGSDLAQAEIARRLNVNRQTVNRFVRGRREWTPERIDQAAAILGVSLSATVAR